MEQALSANTEDDETGQYNNLTLNTGVKPSYVSHATTATTELTPPTQIRTLSETFRATKTTKLRIQTPTKTVTTKALVHENLPQNLRRLTPIVEKLRALLLDKDKLAK